MIRILGLLVLMALPAAAQKLAWKVEVPNIEGIEWVGSDTTGGGIALIREVGGLSHRILWLTNKGAKKAEFDVEDAASTASFSGPFMVTPTRFYLLIVNGEDVKLRRYSVGKNGAATFVDTPLDHNDRLATSFENVPEKTGFFVYRPDLGLGGTGHITRYTH